MKKSSFWVIFLIGSTFFAGSACSHLPDQDDSWLQFRGEKSSGIASQHSTPPSDFGIEKNVLWKIETPEGYSSLIIVNDNLVITGVNREEKKYMIWNIDPIRGSTKWKREIQVETLENVHPISSPAAATPASDGEYIYCFFPTLGLICYDLEGEKIWESPVHFYPLVQGSGTSPIIYKDKLILNHDNNVNPRLLAFDKATGKQLWEYKYQINPLLSSMSWSTPVTWNDQVIIHKLNEIIGVNADSGELLWQFNIGSTGVATPVIIGDTLYVNSWNVRGDESDLGDVKDFQKMFNDCDINSDGRLSKEEFHTIYPEGVCTLDRKIEGVTAGTRIVMWWGQLSVFDADKDNNLSKEEWGKFQELMADCSNHGTVAIKLGETGNITLNSTLWKSKKNVPQIPSVLVSQGMLYMVKQGGIVTYIDAGNGEVVYSGRLSASGPYLSSPLLADGMLFLASYNGKITILKEGRAFEVVNQIDLGEKIGASPVAMGNRLYIRTDSHLYAFINRI